MTSSETQRVCKSTSFFINASSSNLVHRGPNRNADSLLACLHRRWWKLDGVHFVPCHLVRGGRHRCIVPYGVAVAAARMGSLCCDYVGRARRLLIRLWEGACLWIIALWERKKEKKEEAEREMRSTGIRRRRRRRGGGGGGGGARATEREREKPPWLWLWNGLSQIKATGMQAEMSQSLPQTHWLVRLLHWAYLRLYTPRIHRWMYSAHTHTHKHTWRRRGRWGRQEEMSGRERLRTRGESVKTNMFQIGLQLREKGRKGKRGRENCAQGKTQENKREMGERELETVGSQRRQWLK